MLCPFCHTENREDRNECYYCGKDISTIKFVVNKARQHFNEALEHAERNRTIQAIEELNKALDLDSNFVQAHVVIGTLYAREGRFDLAQKSWNEALELKPELAKAHEYLGRLDTVRSALPTLRYFRWIALGLLLGCLALGAYVIILTRPAPGLKSFTNANYFVEQRKYSNALEELKNAIQFSQPNSMIHEAADSLRLSLQNELQFEVNRIQDLKYRQDYPAALAAISSVETLQPDIVTSVALSSIRNDISYYYRNMIETLFLSYQNGQVDLKTLEDQINQYISYYPSQPEGAEFSAYLRQARNYAATNAVRELEERFFQTHDLQGLVSSLREMAFRYQENEGFQQQRSILIENVLTYLFNLFTVYLDERKLMDADVLLQQMKDLTTEFRDVIQVDISGAIDLAGNTLEDTRKKIVFAQIEELIENNEPDAAEEAIWFISFEKSITRIENQILENSTKDIASSRIRKRLESLQKNLPKLLKLKLSKKEQDSILRFYESTLDQSLKDEENVILLQSAASAALAGRKPDIASPIVEKLSHLDQDSTITVFLQKRLETLKQK